MNTTSSASKIFTGISLAVARVASDRPRRYLPAAITKWTMILAASAQIMSCGSILNGSTKEVHFDSDPQGARVFDNGYELGRTPLFAPLLQKRDHQIEFRKEGYSTTSRMLSASPGGLWIVLDVVFGLYPIVIDAATGGWKVLDEDMVRVILEPTSGTR